MNSNVDSPEIKFNVKYVHENRFSSYDLLFLYIFYDNFMLNT